MWALRGHLRSCAAPLRSNAAASKAVQSQLPLKIKPPSRRAPYRPQNLGLLQYISFYQYTSLDSTQLPQLRYQLLTDWQNMGVMGRVYIAEEGINAQITVPMSTLDNFKAYLDDLPWLDDALLNLGAVIDHNEENPEKKCPFHTLHVRVRPHLAYDGLDKNLPMDNRGYELTPEEWHAELQDTSNKRIFDCRNYYEHDVGRFEGAERIMVDTFKDTWESLDSLLEGSPKDTECMIYCTGGIRCEKVGAYLTTKGYTNVKRLKGGIVHYGKYIREHKLDSKFLGRNFVFDQRLSDEDQAYTDDVLAQCYQCGEPCNTHVNCSNTLCHGLIIQCSSCSSQYDGACSASCQEYKHKMDKMDMEERRVFSKQNASKFKHHLVPNSRVRPGNPFHSFSKRSFSTFQIESSPQLNGYIDERSHIPLKQNVVADWHAAISKDYTSAMMQKMITPAQAKYLQFLVQALNATSVLEIGCFTGYSAVAMASAMPNGHVITCDIDPKAIAWTKNQLKVQNVSNVELIDSPGIDLIQRLIKEKASFDFVFVDGSKKDYKPIFDLLVKSDIVKKQGWMVFDNTLFRGQVVDQAYGNGSPDHKTAIQIADFNDHVAQDRRTRSVICPMYDGLTLVQKI